MARTVINVVVLDKNVGNAIRALQAYALEAPQAVPMDEMPEGVTTAPGYPNDKLPSWDHLKAYITANRIKKISTQQMKDYLVTKGFKEAATTHSNALRALMDEGFLRKGDKKGEYEVT